MPHRDPHLLRRRAARVTMQAATRRRAFWPVVLIGIGASGLSALAGHRPLMQVEEARLDQLGVGAVAQSENIKELPLAGAFALVMLACWGVVLVTGRVTRRIVAALAAAAAGGLVLTLIIEGVVKRDEVAIELGAPVDYTGWFWLAIAASVAALVAAVAAMLWAPAWPEMGSRYDAPAAHESQPADAPTEERTSERKLGFRDAEAGSRGQPQLLQVAVARPQHGLVPCQRGGGRGREADEDDRPERTALVHPSSPSSKQVRVPVWHAGPSWSTLSRIASPSQSIRISFTCCRLPDVSPLTQ